MQFTSNAIKLSYEEVHQLGVNIAEHFRGQHIHHVVAIVRGGMLPALVVSHALNAALIPLHWQSRDGEVKDQSERLIQSLKRGDRILFIDDINDSGHTFVEIAREYTQYATVPSNVKFGSLVRKAGSIFREEYTGIEIQDERWIIFPWERQT
jgi:hypoxanthine phosphoribosyltransferase